MIQLNLLNTSLGQRFEPVPHPVDLSALQPGAAFPAIPETANRIVEVPMDVFDPLAGRWDHLFEDPRTAAPWVSFWQPFLKQYRVRSVLVIQASTGNRALALAKAGYRVVATDSSLEMLKVAERKSTLDGLDFQLVHSDINHLPFALGPIFDAVTIGRIQSFSSRDDLESALRVVSSLVWPGGILLWDPVICPRAEASGRFQLREIEGNLPEEGVTLGFTLADGSAGRILVRDEGGRLHFETHVLPPHLDLDSAGDPRLTLGRLGYRFFQLVKTPWGWGNPAVIAAKGESMDLAGR